MKTAFLDKLLSRLDRLDPAETKRLLRRLTEEQGLFAELLDALSEGVIVLAPDGAITSLNRSAARLLNLDPETSLNEPIAELLPLLNWSDLLGHSRSANQDIEVLQPEPRLLNCYVTPIGAKPSKPSKPSNAKSLKAKSSKHNKQTSSQQAGLGYALVVRDVSHSRAQTAQHIEESQLTALTMLAASVAHELGNPLNSLDIHLQLLQRQLQKLEALESSETLGQKEQTGRPSSSAPQAAGLSALVEISRSEVERLDGIIQQFLGAIRPQELETQLRDVNALVLEALEFLRPELEQGGVRLTAQLEADLPPLHLDPDQLKQALYNLLRNARQALRGLDGQLIIRTQLRKESLAIQIEDNGVGMSAAQVSQADQAFRSDRPGGHGLGLLIVRRIIRAHGGKLSIQSEAQQGTQVTLELPLAPQGMRLLPDLSAEASSRASIIDV